MSADTDRDELAELEVEWMTAMQARDRDRLEQLVCDGFRFTAIHLNPEPMSREQWMGAAMEGYSITTFAFEDMEVEVFGGTAVIHARYSQIASFGRSTCRTCSGSPMSGRATQARGRSSPATPRSSADHFE